MNNAKIPVVILVRVSTVKQETARQISELQQHAAAKGYQVVEVCEEKISGSAQDGDRHGLRRAEELAVSGNDSSRVFDVEGSTVSVAITGLKSTKANMRRKHDHPLPILPRAGSIKTLWPSAKEFPGLARTSRGTCLLLRPARC